MESPSSLSSVWQTDERMTNGKSYELEPSYPAANLEQNKKDSNNGKPIPNNVPRTPESEKEESVASCNKDNKSLALQNDCKPRPFIIDRLFIQNFIIFLSYLKDIGEKMPILSKLADRLSSESFDYIIIGLNKSSDRLELQNIRKLQFRAATTSGFKLCSKLKHYKQANPRQRGAGVLTDQQTLSFADRPFDVSHLPAGVPAEMSDMKLEVNRLMSFSVKNLNSFKDLYPQGPSPDWLASIGFFYLQEADKVKCAFCLGALNCQSSDISVQDAHKRRFATCPLLLGLDVGNVSIQKRQSSPELEELAELCTDDSTTCQDDYCNDFSPMAARSPELECGSQLAHRPRLPVSAAVAAKACRLSAADNLETLARSLGSVENASRYHPMRHAGFREQRRREDSFGRSSQPVPSDLLAFAGFFLDSELNTTCFWCGVQINNWLTSDNPWTEHARWSPRCCHLLLECGHEFVLLSRQVSPAYMPQLLQKLQLDTLSHTEEPSGSALSHLSGSNPLIDYRIEQRYFKARDDFPSTLAILQIGCDPTDAKTAQFQQLKSTGDDFPSYEMFMHSVLACSRARQALNLTAQEYYEKVIKDQSLSCSREPKPLSDDDNFDWRACKVCMDKVINVTLLDCKHLCCCSNCARQLDSCPLCRTPIRATMLVNMD